MPPPLTRELTVAVVGLPPPLSPFFFIRFSFGPLWTAPTSPWRRPYGEGILLSYERILPRLRCSCSQNDGILDLDNFHVRLQCLVASLCNQLLPEFSSNQFETLHICYKHIEDVHVTFSRQENHFWQNYGVLDFRGCLRLGLSWFNWWVSFAPEFQCCNFCESSCLFYLSYNFISMFLR